MEKKGSKVKRFVEEHKTAIAVTTGLAIGAVVGGAAIYVATGDARKLWNLLGEYGPNDKTMETLRAKVLQYAGGANMSRHAEPSLGIVKTVADLGDCATAIMENYERDNHLTDEVVGVLVFTNSAKT